MNNAPTIDNPVMLDAVLSDIQTGLVDSIQWLDVAFGRAQRLTKMINGKRVITPNVYCGGWKNHGVNDYIEVSPDSKIGNFSFFEIDDPQTITGDVWSKDIRTPFRLIFWFDLRRVYGKAANRNIEKMKAEVLQVLEGRAGWHLKEGHITIARFYEKIENIYRGYTLSEIDNQFLMHPFGGFAIDGVLEYPELCEVQSS